VYKVASKVVLMSSGMGSPSETLRGLFYIPTLRLMGYHFLT
jgi:hypothetical protein